MNFAVLDFETTGNQPNDEIIQVGIVRVEDGQITDQFQSFVKPTGTVPPFISQLTGITDDQLKNAPKLEDVITEMIPLLDNCALVGHHVAFDYGFLNRALDQCGYGPFQGFVYDLIDLLKICYPGLSGHKLSMVTDHFNIPHDRPHQADSDALATAYLWNMCLEKLEQLPLITLQRLFTIFESTQDELTYLLQQLAENKERTYSIAEENHDVFRRFHLRAGDWKEEEPARDGETLFEYDDFTDFVDHLQEEWSRTVDHFEQRDEQVLMMKEVFEALDHGQHLLVEAGTGTGKSLGYLIPALYHGIRNEQKVIVSTHTINLQEQLNNRDIPLLQKLFPVQFRATVFKGRGHYLCLRKFENKMNMKDYEQRKDERLAAAQMVVWLGETEHGDDEELNLNQLAPNFWQSVSSDADSCLNRACPWFSKCFYHRARHTAQISDVVITNHSLLFTDVKAEHRLLPAYDYLIVDEAHHFEEVAENHLGTSINYFSVANSLQWMYKDKLSGSLPSLIQQLTGSGMENEEKWIESIEHLFDRITRCKEYWDTLTSCLYDWLAIRAKAGTSESGQLVARMERRLDEADDDPEWESIVHAEENVHVELGEIVKILDRLITEIKEENDDYEMQSLLTDLSGSVKDLTRYREELHFLIERNKDDFVYWLEAATAYRMKSLELTAVPIDVSPLLREYFFDRKESIVLTSATLTVDKSFDYAVSALGLFPYQETGRLKTVQLASPFNYREQALVCIPRDFPKLKGASGDEQFITQLVASLNEVARITDGRMLVLFTSYRMLKETYTLLKEALADSGIEVFGQGIDSSNRSKLTERFMKTTSSILLGTGSFWEGVDLPGDSLVCLAIVRLPFQPPNHPVVEAKSERLKAKNQNPFMKYSVPQAVIRFKQGFGRLVRSSQDKGIVIIYDTRVIEQRYGKNFLYSLPGPKMEHMRCDQLANRVEEWLEKTEQPKGNR